MEKHDIVIVGAGPAGSACAYFLGKEGYDVLLVDKNRFPRDNACGDGISEKSISVLNEMGLADIVRKRARIIRRIMISSETGLTINLEFNKSRKMYVIRRNIFDNILFHNAKNFANSKENFLVTDIIKKSEKISIKGINSSGKHEIIKSKIIVGADGSNSIVSKKLSPKNIDSRSSLIALRAYYKIKDLSDVIEIFYTKRLVPGYLWIFPVNEEVANVGLGMLIEDKKKRNININMVEYLDHLLKNDNRIRERFSGCKRISDPMGWTIPLGLPEKIQGDGFILIGDAARLANPLTGEGIGNALISAKIGAEAIKKHIEAGYPLAYYDEMIRKKFRNEMKISYFLHSMVRNGATDFLLMPFFINKRISYSVWNLIKNNLNVV